MNRESMGLIMAIDPEVISYSSNKRTRKAKNLQKWAIYSAGGLAVLVLVGLIKTILPLIGMAFLLTYIWSKSTKTSKY